MVRKKRESGKDGFELSADKISRLHDDRASNVCANAA